MRFKPDSSFFRKIAIGALGALAVRDDLKTHGFHFVELERGATDTKIWKRVKRKRMRIPDLVCLHTGLRVETRAKTTRPSLQMSHSPNEVERSWDYGMVDDDWVAIPVCIASETDHWGQGRLEGQTTDYREHAREYFSLMPYINYFSVGDLRNVRHSEGRRKGVVEASEYSIEWNAKFSTRTGPVRSVERDSDESIIRVSIENHLGRAYTFRVPAHLSVLVSAGQHVDEGQAFASSVPTIRPRLKDHHKLTSAKISSDFLKSTEKTMRFTGVKLARLRRDSSQQDQIRSLAHDSQEDLYVKLEALAYLASVLKEPVRELFNHYVSSNVDQDALEAVICIGEVGNRDALDILEEILQNFSRPLFLRTAAAWALGRTGDRLAQQVLIRAFSVQDIQIQQQAIHSLVDIGQSAISDLLEGLDDSSDDVAAGCAEALRQQGLLTEDDLSRLVTNLSRPDEAPWAIWLVGNLPQHLTASSVANLENLDGKVHYALSLLWSFSRSWISNHWQSTLPNHKTGQQ